MANADGSIVIATEIDDKQAQAELNRLTKKIDTLNEKITSKKQEQMPLVKQAKELGATLDATKAKLADMQSGDSFFTKNAVKAQEMEVKNLQKEYDGVQVRVEKIDASIQKDTATLGRMQEKAGELSAQLAGAGKNTNGLSDAMSQAEKYMGKITKRIATLARRIFVFSLITQGLRSMKDMLVASIKTNAEATTAVARLKAALLTLAQLSINVIIPAFTMLVNILTSIITTIANLLSMLFGSTLEQSSAESLYNEEQALNGVGSAAKKASKSLASFDEINKLTAANANGGGSKNSSIAPDFDALKNKLLTGLTFTLDDIFFDWENLTAEDILAKIITFLSALCGGIIGWTIGGPGGAVLGALIGAGIGLLISNLLFDGDGTLSQKEILQSIILALGALVGGIIGFTLGGVGGAAIGVLLGAGISLLINKIIFDGDGVLSQEEILTSAITALGGLVGAIIGFTLGGVGGAAIGAIIGTGLTLSILKALFNGDGTLDQNEILSTVAVALSALVGGIIGFAVGGIGGAALGAIIGTGITATILSLGFEKTGISAEQIVGGLVEVLIGIVGGLIGFAVGGSGGAVIGAVVGVGLSLILDKAIFKNNSGAENAGYNEGKELGENINEGAADALGVHSPSTTFHALGDNCMQGMANGITDSQARVLETFQAVLEQLMVAYDTWEVNFMAGFADFRAVFTDQWLSFWSLIGYYFTTKWNNILQTLQTGVNYAIDALNSLVAAANSLAELTGVTYRSVNRIVVPSISLPKLAAGAVIPPNREFLAVLGDQKSGTNIETPLTTMVQAFRQALSEGGYSGQNEAVLMVNEETLGKLVYRLNKAENARIGVNLAEA